MSEMLCNRIQELEVECAKQRDRIEVLEKALRAAQQNGDRVRKSTIASKYRRATAAVRLSSKRRSGC